MKKTFIIVYIFLILTIILSEVFATNVVIDETSDTLKLNDMISSLKSYSETSQIGSEIDLKEISKNLVAGKSSDYSKLIQKVIDIFSGEVIKAIKSIITVLIVIVLMGIFSCLELDKNSSIGKIVYLVSIIVIVTILSNVYLKIIKSYAKNISILTSIMQTVTPFMTIVMIAKGGIISSKLLEPIILFIASFVGSVINYVVIPFITISIVMKIISSLGENIRLKKLGELFSKSGLYITTVSFTLLLSFISLKGNISTSVDAVTIKTTQTAVSNFIPVVGKFVSDSLESIMGAAEVVGKTAGTLGIIVMVVVTIVPLIQMLVIFVSHKILAAFSDMITGNKNTVAIVDTFADTYKILLGILVGVLSVFLMATGLLINLMGKIK